MIFERYVTDVFAENCYVLADANRRRAVVVDPGAGTAAPVAAILHDHDLHLDAVLLTHGHPDHVWDAAAVAGDTPVYVPAPDAYRLENPLETLSALAPVLASVVPTPYRQPANVQPLPAEFFTGGGAELVPGVSVRALAAPGHTEGSTLYFMAGEWPQDIVAEAGASGGERLLVLTGDVIFRDSIGRTDLPGGDGAVMVQTLRTLKQVIDPAGMLFPGHGPATTMRRELTHNPFLA
ncbi:MAG TPA: MBL fold metallo-hydrolase [Actinomycetaceae bacterium]|nr:MBL fold metallo-hydrolase [Actinomycetaceae bacterium]